MSYAGLLVSTSLFAQGSPLPAPVRAFEQQGVTLFGSFESASGLPAWAASVNGRPLSIYATPDGKHAVVGTMFNAQGQDVDEKALFKLVTDASLKALQNTNWLMDGNPSAPRVAYVFTDPNCPYCNKFWSDARPWVSAGKVQLRHILVGIIKPTSAGKAAALLSQKDPAAALAAYERTLAGTKDKGAKDATLKPLLPIPERIAEQLKANQRLMEQLGLDATPALAWVNAAGNLKTRTGAPASSLIEILGAK
ncbi:thiol:disulfide interchange protein DsbG [Pseudorhodoferax soli]|uniref:Thiol:disulfide interchange protein n=1 Tax=Pseudorhodoferax soli TaxID=545864 RepID=A0A368XKI5_9BURK|nr:thiol:disulfide interchange protein DsbG [Pseudorhodoferax soli]RCW68541.1 thiol:disulfide interchange protein DsbC [Pseudorhodoferax soli]